MLGVLLALALASPPPCTCPDSIGAEAGAEPLAVVPGRDGLPGLVVCGARIDRDADDVMATEFDVFTCGADTPVLTSGAAQTARIHTEAGRLVITEIDRWPFGPSWEWVWVPIWSHTVTPDENPPRVSTRLILEPPALTPKQVAEALDPLKDASAISPDDYEAVIGRVFAAALAGIDSDDGAVKAFHDLPKVLALDGAAAETYGQADEIYDAYGGTCRRPLAEKRRDRMRRISLESATVTIQPRMSRHISEPEEPTVTLTTAQVNEFRLILEDLDIYSPCPGGHACVCGDYGIQILRDDDRWQASFCEACLNIHPWNPSEDPSFGTQLSGEGARRLREFFDAVARRTP